MEILIYIVIIFLLISEINKLKKENKFLLNLFTIHYNTKKWSILNFRKTYVAKNIITKELYPCEKNESIFIINER